MLIGFDVRHENVQQYRSNFFRLNTLLLRLADEKGKGDPLVSWFRLRNRRVAQVLEPMKHQVVSRIATEEERLFTISNALNELRRVNNAIRSNRDAFARRVFDESIAPVLNDSFRLSLQQDRAFEQINEIEQKFRRDLRMIQNDIDFLNQVSTNVDRVKELFTNTRRTIDIDIEEFSNAISSVNQQIKLLDLDVPELKELPETFDKNVVASLHEEIRAVIAEIESQYKMGLLDDYGIKTVYRTIIHDVGNNRGKKAFMNRSNELVSYANEFIKRHNKKYWQITGLRWERIGREAWGYVRVAPTHEPIAEI